MDRILEEKLEDFFAVGKDVIEVKNKTSEIKDSEKDLELFYKGIQEFKKAGKITPVDEEKLLNDYEEKKEKIEQAKEAQREAFKKVEKTFSSKKEKLLDMVDNRLEQYRSMLKTKAEIEKLENKKKEYEKVSEDYKAEINKIEEEIKNGNNSNVTKLGYLNTLEIRNRKDNIERIDREIKNIKLNNKDYINLNEDDLRDLQFLKNKISNMKIEDVEEVYSKCGNELENKNHENVKDKNGKPEEHETEGEQSNLEQDADNRQRTVENKENNENQAPISRDNNESQTPISRDENYTDRKFIRIVDNDIYIKNAEDAEEEKQELTYLSKNDLKKKYWETFPKKRIGRRNVDYALLYSLDKIDKTFAEDYLRVLNEGTDLSDSTKECLKDLKEKVGISYEFEKGGLNILNLKEIRLARYAKKIGIADSVKGISEKSVFEKAKDMFKNTKTKLLGSVSKKIALKSGESDKEYKSQLESILDRSQKEAQSIREEDAVTEEEKNEIKQIANTKGRKSMEDLNKFIEGLKVQGIESNAYEPTGKVKDEEKNSEIEKEL